MHHSYRNVNLCQHHTFESWIEIKSIQGKFISIEINCFYSHEYENTTCIFGTWEVYQEDLSLSLYGVRKFISGFYEDFYNFLDFFKKTFSSRLF